MYTIHYSAARYREHFLNLNIKISLKDGNKWKAAIFVSHFMVSKGQRVLAILRKPRFEVQGFAGHYYENRASSGAKTDT